MTNGGRWQKTVSTHSRAKAAAPTHTNLTITIYSFNTQPREGGCRVFRVFDEAEDLFQHTAARRRLLDRAVFHVPT